MDAVATPEELIEQLDPERLTARLNALDGERRAVMILLRAALARERGRPTARQCRQSEASRVR
jgi:hypothetical protein